MDDLFHHVLAVLHDAAYNQVNADALRAERPRILLPGWPHGETTSAVDELAESAALGRELARLLDPDKPVPGITTGTLRPEAAAIAVPSTTGGRNMAGEDLAVTAGWGHFGTGDAVMPGQGQVVERTYTPDECAALGTALPVLGDTAHDIYLNDRAYWRNVPGPVWNYKIGGLPGAEEMAVLPRARGRVVRWVPRAGGRLRLARGCPFHPGKGYDKS